MLPVREKAIRRANSTELVGRGRRAVILREIEYGSEHYNAARALREAILRAPLGLSLSAEDLRGEAGQLHFALFADDDELVACVIAVPVSATQARIRQTAVAPAFQRQGVARKMMCEVEAILSSRGFNSLTLHARTSAVGFYEKLGYESVGNEFIEVTLPHLEMVKRLA